jgi:hypothetical protein
MIASLVYFNLIFVRNLYFFEEIAKEMTCLSKSQEKEWALPGGAY